MTTPLEDHGGSIPPAFHTVQYPDTPNKLVVLLEATKDTPNLTFYNFLELNRIYTIIYKVPSTFHNAHLHESIIYVSNEKSNETIIEDCLSIIGIPYVFWICIDDLSIVHPNVWTELTFLKPGQSVEFDDGKQIHCTQRDKSIMSKKYQKNGCLTYEKTDDQRVFDAVSYAMQRKARCTVNELIVHVDDSFTPLCHLAVKYGTDKCVYNILFHKHPYTPIYDMFLNPFQAKGNTFKLGEIGVLRGSSIQMWREYFPLAQIHGFDIEDAYLDYIRTIPGVSSHLVNAGESKGLRESLMKATQGQELFDVLLEDASHRLEHQLIFLRDAIDFVKPGGLLIIEDIFREISKERFQEALDTLRDKVANAILIRPEHKLRQSYGWENDRILVVWKR